jgi:hypothetical protein
MILTNALILALIIYFIKATTWEGHIWEKQGKALKEKLPEKLYKPIIGCPICMTPWWGTLLYLSFSYLLDIQGFQDKRFQVIVITVFVAAGINTVILMFNQLYTYFNKREDLLDKELKDNNIKS